VSIEKQIGQSTVYWTTPVSLTVISPTECHGYRLEIGDRIKVFTASEADALEMCERASQQGKPAPVLLDAAEDWSRRCGANFVGIYEEKKEGAYWFSDFWQVSESELSSEEKPARRNMSEFLLFSNIGCSICSFIFAGIAFGTKEWIVGGCSLIVAFLSVRTIFTDALEVMEK
jgi:hypothetical protein